MQHSGFQFFIRTLSQRDYSLKSWLLNSIFFKARNYQIYMTFFTTSTCPYFMPFGFDFFTAMNEFSAVQLLAEVGYRSFMAQGNLWYESVLLIQFVCSNHCYFGFFMSVIIIVINKWPKTWQATELTHAAFFVLD